MREKPFRFDVIVDPLQARLRVALREAMKAKDAVAISALRSALSAVGNAEAVAPAEPGAPFRPTLGVGAADVARRELSLDEASRLRAEGDVLLGVLEER